MEFVRKLTALFYPERCPYCSALIEATQIACEVCYNEIRRKHLPTIKFGKNFKAMKSAFIEWSGQGEYNESLGNRRGF